MHAYIRQGAFWSTCQNIIDNSDICFRLRLAMMVYLYIVKDEKRNVNERSVICFQKTYI